MLTAGLYLVATPIGNMRDITLRALDVLQDVSVIAAEDTRVTRNLLTHYQIDTPLIAYHDHNADRAGPQLLDRLSAGEAVALVSDAGTPLIADPGFRLVNAAHEKGIFVTALPGASSTLAALSVSGLPTDRFHFCGFPPVKRLARQRCYERWARIDSSLVILEGVSRLAASLNDLALTMGPRPAAVARELTKRFESLYRGTLPELAQQFGDSLTPKGEVVVVVGPPPADDAASDLSPAALTAALKQALLQQSLRDAVEEVAALTGMPRRKIYAEALVVKAKMEEK